VSRSDHTRLAMLRAAERLFAEKGVDTVSLREIASAAGQGNHSAALYHFGDKRQLLEAVLHRHSGPIDDALARDVPALVARGEADLTTLVELLVAPLVAKLDDADGGPAYLQICAELVNNRSFPIPDLRAANGPGSAALRVALLRAAGDAPTLLLPLRMLRTAAVLFCSIAAYQRLVEAGLDVPRDLFRRDLVTSVEALLRSTPAAKRTPKAAKKSLSRK
jgi:AcrR family transcriptional regulator